MNFFYQRTNIKLVNLSRTTKISKIKNKIIVYIRNSKKF